MRPTISQLTPLLLVLILASCIPKNSTKLKQESETWMNSTGDKLHYLREEIVYNRQLEDAAENPAVSAKLKQLYREYNSLAERYDYSTRAKCKRECMASAYEARRRTKRHTKLQMSRASYSSYARDLCTRTCRDVPVYRKYYVIPRRPRK